jgi:hypothetical protein
MPNEEICTSADAAQPNWATYARDPNARLRLLVALIEQAQLIEVIAFSLLANEVDDTPEASADRPTLDAATAPVDAH